MNKKLFGIALSLVLIGCGDSMIEEREISLPGVGIPIPSVIQPKKVKIEGFYDCLASIGFINGESLGLRGVIKVGDDISTDLPGIQMLVGVVLYGEVSPSEEVKLFVNGDDVYYPKKFDNIYWAWVDLRKPVDTILFRAYSIGKDCYSNSFISTVDFDWR